MSSNQALQIASDELRAHWQGHRALTRRVIDAFPEEELFGYAMGGMRPFAELAMEMIRLAEAGMRGLTTGSWTVEMPKVKTKDDLFRLWDGTTKTIDELWTELPDGWFEKSHAAFGQWEGTGRVHLFYWIENEVHHRGQGYVYLRGLGIQPPAFYERG